MTVQTPPWSIQGSSHPAEVARSAVAALLGVPVAAHTAAASVTTAGGGHGVVGSGDLAVAENGTPNMSVNVAAGRALIRAGHTGNITSGCYGFLNDATVNLAIAASDPTNPRYDLILAQVRDTNYGEAASDARLVVVTGTPAASPADPSLTSYPNSLVLARVQVDAAAASITNAKITDLRTRAHALGGIWIGTSSQRPTGASLHEGKPTIDTTNDRFLLVDGSSVEQRAGWYSATGRTGGRWRRVATQSCSSGGSGVTISWDTEDADSDGFLVPHATSGTTFTVPAGCGGLYSISCRMVASAAVVAQHQIALNVTAAATGVSGYWLANGYGAAAMHIAVPGIPLAAGDTFDISAYQVSGSSKTYTGWIAVTRIGC